MLHPINLYTLSRIRDPYCFGVVERNDSGSADRRQPRVHEMFSLRALAEKLTALGVSVEEMDGFFFGYTIPHIGKEFDLLKITEKGCLNIELKSEEVSEEKIRDQLRRNRHYLRPRGGVSGLAGECAGEVPAGRVFPHAGAGGDPQGCAAGRERERGLLLLPC